YGFFGHHSAPYTPGMVSGGPAGASAMRSSRILIVDDDPNLLVLLAEQLREDGFEIATARDGQEALRRLESGWPDPLIIDMMMPRMDGLTLAREIKGRADLPIIVLTISRSRSEEHTSELQSLRHLVCRLLLEKKK